MADMLFKAGFANPVLRGKDSGFRPWNLPNIINAHSGPSFDLLDIGCGTSHKILQHAASFRKIYGIDPSEVMREMSIESISRLGISNIEISNGVSQHIPFADESFDVVTCMLAPFHIQEPTRVLKKGGYLIREAIGDQDKIEMKKLFGRDSQGWRGQYMNGSKPLSEMIRQEMEGLYTDILIQDGFWNTVLTEEGLLMLLDQTPTIRDYDKEKDVSVVNEIKKMFSKNGQIELKQHRILVVGRKSKF